jgi:Glycosyl hydrolases family 43
MIQLHLKRKCTFGMAAALVLFAQTRVQADEIRNDEVWLDTKGNRIDCHEGSILRVGDTFYWYGRAYNGHKTGMYGKEGAKYRCGLNVYSSKDLVNWTNRGACLPYPESGWVTEGTWHRPRVLYNKQTKKYVLWFFVHLSKYPCPLVVATADEPAGPFTILGSPRRGFTKGGDLALYKEPDGAAYLAVGDEHADNLVFRLADDYLSTTGEPAIALKNRGQRYEAASMVRYKGKYIVAGSYMAGLAGSATTYSIADKPQGPYIFQGEMSKPGTKTWDSQLLALVYIAESDQVFAMCERWFRNPKGEQAGAEESSQLWLPVKFDPVKGVAEMEHKQRWTPSLQRATPPDPVRQPGR